MDIYKSAISFFTNNTATVLLIVSILYFAYFIIRMIRARKTGEEFTYRIKYFIAFAIIIALAIYCLVTGKNLSEYIN